MPRVPHKKIKIII